MCLAIPVLEILDMRAYIKFHFIYTIIRIKLQPSVRTCSVKSE